MQSSSGLLSGEGRKLLKRQRIRLLQKCSGLFGMVILLGDYSWGFAAIMVMIFTFSLMCWIPEIQGMEEPGYFSLIVLGIVFLLSLEKIQFVQQFSFAAFFVILLLKVLYANRKAMDEYVRNRAASTWMDEKKLKKLNDIFSFSYTGILCLILLVVSMFQTDGITRRIGAWIWNLIAMLLGNIESGEGGSTPSHDALALEIGKTSKFFVFLELLIKLIAAFVLVALIIYILYIIIKLFCNQFYNRTDKMENAQDYAEPLTVSRKIQRRKRKHIFDGINRTPARQVRKRYKNYVYASLYGKDKNMYRLNPKEQLAAIKLPDEKAEELLELYEKARYSKSEVTREDLLRMKDLISRP